MAGLNPLVEQFLKSTQGGQNMFPGGRATNRAMTPLGERYAPPTPQNQPLVGLNAGAPVQTRSGGVGGQVAPYTGGSAELRQYVNDIAKARGWDGNQINAWYNLIERESSWNPNAQNPNSTAFGLGQFLNSTWAGVGMQKTSDPRLQLEAMARYIENRYQNPAGAWAFWQNPTSGPEHWY